MIFNWTVDVLLVAFVLIGAIIGYKRGFVKTVAKPVKLILALVIAFSFARGFGEGVIYPTIYSPLENMISSFLLENYPDLSVENISELPTLIKFSATLAGVDLEALAAQNEGATLLDLIVEAIAGPAVSVVSSIIGFVILYAVSRILLWLAVSILASIVEGGAVGVLNSLLGCVFSLLLSAFSVWALVSVFDFVLNLPAIADTAFAKEFTGGYVFRFLKGLNPIELLLSF